MIETCLCIHVLGEETTLSTVTYSPTEELHITYTHMVFANPEPLKEGDGQSFIWLSSTCWVTFLNKKVSKESWERKSLHEGRDALLLKPVAGNKLHSDEPARSTINSSWKEQEAADTA
jgi:hypothetical protein